MRALNLCFLVVAACGGEEEPPRYSHAEPDEAAAQTCVLCHACGTDGTGTFSGTAPSPGQSHTGCQTCHQEDPAVHNTDVGSNWQKTCDPPAANCDACHTGGVTPSTITDINDACRRCHDAE